MLRYFSPGIWFVVLLAIGSSIYVSNIRDAKSTVMTLWMFDKYHEQGSQPAIEEWNDEHPDKTIKSLLLTGSALVSRMRSGFYSDTPVGDLIEVERTSIGQVFAGPLEDIGFIDLTDRLKEENLMSSINGPSFSPWTSRGRIFGLPHDVHPVMLLYRADIVEAAGIDMTQIETWDDYFRVLRPLMKDFDGDGRVDRYLLSASPVSLQEHEVFMLQAGGGYFDQQGTPTLNSEINIKVMSQLATWYAGPNRATSTVPPGVSSSQLIADGYVIGYLAADWRAGHMRKKLPSMAGKFKLMPLPAWEKGGRRVSVQGGTMLGITKANPHHDEAWEFAKKLYLSPETAKHLYEHSRIITPIKDNWDADYYDEPDPYFCNQPIGRMYINLAPEVPLRSSSPFYGNAQQALNAAIIDLSNYTESNNISDPAELKAECRRLLNRAQQILLRQMERNAFLRETSA